ncbi:MAG: hypothetical protein Q8N99_08585, partial [Nanoarchaeota archaeon]|nr:hypothetical protein [Nanoarchaeota archaeon]
KKNFQKFFWAIQNLKILKVSNLPRQSLGVLNPDLKIKEINKALYKTLLESIFCHVRKWKPYHLGHG